MARLVEILIAPARGMPMQAVARVRGLRLCEPCSHLAAITTPAVLPELLYHAGLRAQILNAGVLTHGDPLVTGSPAPVLESR